MRVISDVEDLVYKATDGKQKHNWNDDTMIAFNSIRHKLLDKSGDIGRLPDTLKEKSEIVEKDDGEAFIEKIFW